MVVVALVIVVVFYVTTMLMRKRKYNKVDTVTANDPGQIPLVCDRGGGASQFVTNCCYILLAVTNKLVKSM